MRFNCLKDRDTLRGGSLISTTQFPVIPRTHLNDIWRMKDLVYLGATQQFWTRTPGLGIQLINHRQLLHNMGKKSLNIHNV